MRHQVVNCSKKSTVLVVYQVCSNRKLPLDGDFAAYLFPSENKILKMCHDLDNLPY